MQKGIENTKKYNKCTNYRKWMKNTKKKLKTTKIWKAKIHKTAKTLENNNIYVYVERDIDRYISKK